MERKERERVREKGEGGTKRESGNEKESSGEEIDRMRIRNLEICIKFTHPFDLPIFYSCD